MPFMESFSDRAEKDGVKMEPSLSATETSKYPLIDSTIRKKAISASNVYPNNPIICQPEDKKEKREHSENLSTNMSRDIQTF